MVEANGVPVLSYWRLGKGTVVYDGLEKDSDFYMRPEYPIFWYQMVNWMTGVPEIAGLQPEDGRDDSSGGDSRRRDALGHPHHDNSAPGRGGIYTAFRGKTVAANMYDPMESDLSQGPAIRQESFRAASRETVVEKDLSSWLIALAALAIVLELAIMSWRRET